MITIIASGQIKAGCRDAFMEVATRLVYDSQGEPGNITYHLCENSEEPDEVIFLEAWEDQEAIEFHRTTEHYKTLVPELAKYLNGKMRVVLYKRLV